MATRGPARLDTEVGSPQCVTAACHGHHYHGHHNFPSSCQSWMSSSSPTHLAALPHCLAIPPAGRSAGRRGQTPPGKRSETGTTFRGNTRRNGPSFFMDIKDDLIYNCIVLTITIAVLVLTITISITTLPHHHHNHTTLTTQTAKKHHHHLTFMTGSFSSLVSQKTACSDSFTCIHNCKVIFIELRLNPCPPLLLWLKNMTCQHDPMTLPTVYPNYLKSLFMLLFKHVLFSR